jgi:predicted SprT family Zn-dependent metalloprotease
MNISQAQTLAIYLMDKHNLLSKGWHFKFDGAKRRLGCCNYTKRTISLSREWTTINDEAEVQDTILHEIAHALTPGCKHNHVWRAKAIEIGCNGNRLFNSTNHEKPTARYEATCPGCKKKYGAHRMKRRSSSCGKCSGGRYNEKYKLVYQLAK